jgi:hypothetical protein
MTANRFVICSETDLVIDEFEKLEGYPIKLVADRSNNGSDGVLNSSDPRF